MKRRLRKQVEKCLWAHDVKPAKLAYYLRLRGYTAEALAALKRWGLVRDVA